MSLDVYLYDSPRVEKCRCADCDNEHERTVTPMLFSGNITHNLNRMAEAAGIYKHLWRPGELGIKTAGELIEPLRAGLAGLLATPAYFKTFDPENGWGSYDGLVMFVENYLRACVEHPHATVEVSR